MRFKPLMLLHIDFWTPEGKVLETSLANGAPFLPTKSHILLHSKLSNQTLKIIEHKTNKFLMLLIFHRTHIKKLLLPLFSCNPKPTQTTSNFLNTYDFEWLLFPQA